MRSMIRAFTALGVLCFLIDSLACTSFCGGQDRRRRKKTPEKPPIERSEIELPEGLILKELSIQAVMGHQLDDIAIPIVAPYFGLTHCRFDVKLEGRWQGKPPQGQKRIVRLRLYISEQEYCSIHSLFNRAKRIGVVVEADSKPKPDSANMKKQRHKVFKMLNEMNRKPNGHRDWFVTELMIAIPEEFDEEGKCTIPALLKTLDHGHRERPWGTVFRVQVVPDKGRIIKSPPTFTLTGTPPKYQVDANFYRRLVQVAQDIRLIDMKTSRTLRRWIGEWELEQRRIFREDAN